MIDKGTWLVCYEYLKSKNDADPDWIAAAKLPGSTFYTTTSGEGTVEFVKHLMEHTGHERLTITNMVKVGTK